MRFFRAQVINHEDPLKEGRCQVRINGLHPVGSSFDVATDEHLPWAEIMGSTEFGLSSGIGVSSVLREGTWVWVFLEEENEEKPVIFGVIKAGGDYEETAKAESGSSTYTDIATLKTESGHLIELDDTPGYERIKITHKTGTYIHIDENGDIFVNGIRDMQFDVARNFTFNVGGVSNWTTTGNTTIIGANIHLNP